MYESLALSLSFYVVFFCFVKENLLKSFMLAYFFFLVINAFYLKKKVRIVFCILLRHAARKCNLGATHKQYT